MLAYDTNKSTSYHSVKFKISVLRSIALNFTFKEKVDDRKIVTKWYNFYF